METQQPPPVSPSSQPQELPPQRLKLYLGIVSIVAVALLTAICWIVPSESHKLEQAKEEIRKHVKAEENYKQEMESWKSTVSAMNKSRRTRTTYKVALDEKGQVVRMADGDPLILMTTTSISSSASSSSSTEATQIRTEYQAKLDAKEAYIKELLKKEDVKRGQGWSLVGYYGNLGTVGGDATGSLGLLRLGVGGQVRPTDKAVEGFARAGFGW